MSHENITFNDNGTLSAIPHHPLEWREELSGGRREDDIFYLPNIALLVSVIISVCAVCGNYAGRMQDKNASHPRTYRFWENPFIWLPRDIFLLFFDSLRFFFFSAVHRLRNFTHFPLESTIMHLINILK
jgi:hypothetical protein